MIPRVGARLRVEGTVQGVGFRPFVFRLATERELGGWVANDPCGVTIEVEGREAAVTDFVEALRSPPPLARVSRVEVQPLPASGRTSFVIAASSSTGRIAAAVAVDTATCPACLAEVADPAARRFGYPFTNCTDCGPRFTIVTGVPYDRERTTMSRFPMCPACRAEYVDPMDRRFHAEPVCCPACGPRLSLTTPDARAVGDDPLRGAARLLRQGRILAVKGLGGYHLATLAGDEEAVAALRRRKVREEKPFALMVADLDAAAALCRLAPEEAALLSQPARPIVLLRRRPGAPVAPSVAPGTAWLGLMLPYTPLHHLLMEEVGAPIVLTSGNRSDEPIAYHDDDAYQRLAGIADAFLVHDRPIHTRTDDSVARVVDGSVLLLRRSRGYVPGPITLPLPVTRPVLACGAQLKNTFCLARGRQAVVSHHLGDLEDALTYRSWLAGIAHLQELLAVRPEVLAHDLHPEYLSTKYALEQEGCELVGVQHHHAHIASCLVDNSETGPVIGAALDGFGWGPDGTMWGGEILVADLGSFRRVGSLAPVPLPGGAAAVREPWRMAAAYLDAAYGGDGPGGLAVESRHPEMWSRVTALCRAERTLRTSSAGRLFDATAALIGIRDRATFEGQAAIELEQHADPAERGAYPAAVVTGPHITIHGADLIRAAAEDLRRGVATPVISARFHHGLADAVVAACSTAAAGSGLATVALSGGVFQNLVFLHRVRCGLESAGLRVLVHHQVPPNDGGISLGQAAVAAARTVTCAGS